MYNNRWLHVEKGYGVGYPTGLTGNVEWLEWKLLMSGSGGNKFNTVLGMDRRFGYNCDSLTLEGAQVGDITGNDNKVGYLIESS